MNNRKITVAMAMLALVFGACNNTGSTPANGGPKADGTVGKVEFNLDLEDSDGNVVDSVDTIALNLVCPGINQDHVLDVTDGAVTAEFGGLEPGMCTVSLEATTNDNGYNCAGEEDFVVVAGEVISVGVTLICIGENDDMGGGATVNVGFEVNDCADDRIKKIWAIPSNVLTGASTTVNAELENLVGTPSITWAVAAPTAGYVGEASVQPGATCDADAQSCQAVLCEGIGTSTALDPVTNLPTAAVWVTITVEDAECRDTERVSIDCLVGSECGDGVVEGAEQCDDGNTTSGDGCQSDCRLPAACGNGTLNAGEACDPGLSGTECIGCADPAEQTCSATCTIVPECGNGIVESGEACDAGTLGSATCSTTCTLIAEGDACLECIQDPANLVNTAVYEPNCNETSHPACFAILTCMAESRCLHLSDTGSLVECFCGDGADLNNCVNSSTFVDVGPCRDEIVAANPAGRPRTEIVNDMALCNAPGLYGCAGNIIDLATNFPEGGCVGACDAPVAP